MNDSEKLKLALTALSTISSVGNRLSSIECEASVYTLDDDEFGDVMFMRNLSDEALRKI